MESLTFLLLAVVIYLIYRLNAMEKRINKIAKDLAGIKSRVPEPEPVALPPSSPERARASARRPGPDWESLIGGNWLNKAGVLLLVIGIALALGYSFAHVGPAGRVATSLTVSLAMLAAGVVIERRERYRIFGRGLIGGGWAALYFTVYAMHAVQAARVLDDPFISGVLLFAVATGIIAHALRYRTQTVAGVAYFIAFATLAITEVTTFSVIALVPLAASLLYLARRFEWPLFARFGLIATYATCAFRGDTGAPLWTALSVFAVYWLLFEGFDLLRPDPWLVPLNGVGFLMLAVTKWNRVAPDQLWQLLAATAAVHLAGAVLRARSGRWHTAATFTAILAAIAILLRAEPRWAPYWLLAEGELFYLAGLRFRAPYLRLLAGTVLTLEGAYVAIHVDWVAAELWTPAALLSAATFYVNRVLRPLDIYYGYAGAVMLGLIIGYRVPRNEVGVCWMALGILLFLVGHYGRMPDFRVQALALASAAFFASWVEPAREAAIVVACLYVGQALIPHSSRWKIPASLMATFRLTALLYAEVSGSLLTMAWGAQGVLLLAAGFPLRDHVLRLSGMALLAGCILKLFAYDLRNLDTLPRIFSFIVLGLILVGVSWLYTRFREQLQRYL